MNTLELFDSLKGEQENNDINSIKSQEYFSDSCSSDEKVSDSISTKQEASNDNEKPDENKIIGGVKVSNFEIQMEDQDNIAETESPKKETPKRRKRVARRAGSGNVYAKEFLKDINSYAEVDNKYSFLEEDTEESFAPSSLKKMKMSPEKPQPQIQAVPYEAPTVYKSSLQGSAYTNPNCIIISRELFAMLLSMSDKTIISQYPNDYHFIYSPNFYNTINEMKPVARVVQAYTPQVPIRPSNQVVIPFDQKQFPCASVSHLSMKRCVVQTSYGYAFLSTIVPKNGFE